MSFVYKTFFTFLSTINYIRQTELNQNSDALNSEKCFWVF